MISGKNSELSFYDKRENVLRSRSVEINDKLFHQGYVSEGDVLILSFFDGLEHTGKVTGLSENIEGTISITLKLNSSESDFMVITKKSDRISANFSPSGSGNIYQIISDQKNGQHYLIEINKKDMGELESGPVLIPGERKQ